MANHMAEVAKMLGVELGEEFEVSVYSSRKCKITESGISVYDDDIWKSGMPSASFILENLLAGRYTIKRKPWKPSVDDIFWLVDQNGDLIASKWKKYTEQLVLYKIGNCYRTYEEAEANRDKWVAFYASDEVLEV